MSRQQYITVALHAAERTLGGLAAIFDPIDGPDGALACLADFLDHAIDKTPLLTAQALTRGGNSSSRA